MPQNMRIRSMDLVRAALMSAIAILLMQPVLEIPLPFLPPWLKIDLSTVPILLTGFALGPGWGVAVQGVKSILHIPFGTTGGIGEIADFLVGCAMMLPASVVYLRHRTRRRAVIGMAIGVGSMILVGMLVNYYIMLPLYFDGDPGVAIAGAMGEGSAINSVATYIMWAVAPFNLVKGVLSGAVTFILYKYLGKFLHGERI